MNSSALKILISILAIAVSIYLLGIRDLLGISYKRNIRSADNYLEFQEFEKAKDHYIKALEFSKNDEYCLNQIANCNYQIRQDAQQGDLEGIEKKGEINYKIAMNGVGGIEVGMKLSEIQKVYNKENEFFNTIIESCSGACDVPDLIIVKDKLDSLLIIAELGFRNPEIIHSVGSFSPKYSTYNGIHIGISISEYLKSYPEAVLYKYPDGPVTPIEREYFRPPDLQSNRAELMFMVLPYDREDYLLGKDKNSDRNTEYNKNGYISKVLIEMK